LKVKLDTIYIQAKRWDGTVGRPEIQTFIGALQMKGAKKGIFITASNFSKEAKESVDMTGSTKIVLIDGELLVNLMIQNDIGVSKIASYEIKQIDSDYFSEE
jgi:restriction system protein